MLPQGNHEILVPQMTGNALGILQMSLICEGCLVVWDGKVLKEKIKKTTYGLQPRSGRDAKAQPLPRSMCSETMAGPKHTFRYIQYGRVNFF